MVISTERLSAPAGIFSMCRPARSVPPPGPTRAKRRGEGVGGAFGEPKGQRYGGTDYLSASGKLRLRPRGLIRARDEHQRDGHAGGFQEKSAKAVHSYLHGTSWRRLPRAAARCAVSGSGLKLQDM